jgi:hypothetical protein
MDRAATNGLHPSMLRAVAAYGLAGTMLDLPEDVLDDRQFIKLNREVRSQRLTGLLWSAIADGSFPVTPSQRERAEESHIQRLAAVLVLEDLLLQTVEALRDAGVPCRVLKGPAVAHLDYPDPAQRVFGDVDLLVPGSSFDVAVATLEAAGCRRRFPEPRPGFERRFGKGACMTADGLEIDLHRTFVMGPYGERLALDALWERHETFQLSGTRIATLSAEGRLLHAAYHTVLGDRCPRLVPMRDVAQMVLTKAIDYTSLRALMKASAGEAVVARAVRLTWHELQIADVLAISAWSGDYAEDRRAAADLSLYGAASTYAARSFGTVRAIPTWSGKAQYLAALTLPDQGYLAGRDAGQIGRLRRGIREIAQARGPA